MSRQRPLSPAAQAVLEQAKTKPWRVRHALDDGTPYVQDEEAGGAHSLCVFFQGAEEHEAEAITASVNAYARDRELLAMAREALSGLFALLEDGTLVRDISRDAEPGWAMRQLPLTQALAKAQQVLAALGTEA